MEVLLLLDPEMAAERADGLTERFETPLCRSDGTAKALRNSHDEFGDVEHEEKCDSSTSYAVTMTGFFFSCESEYRGCEYIGRLCEDADLHDSKDGVSDNELFRWLFMLSE